MLHASGKFVWAEEVSKGFTILKKWKNRMIFFPYHVKERHSLRSSRSRLDFFLFSVCYECLLVWEHMQGGLRAKFGHRDSCWLFAFGVSTTGWHLNHRGEGKPTDQKKSVKVPSPWTTTQLPAGSQTQPCSAAPLHQITFNRPQAVTSTQMTKWLCAVQHNYWCKLWCDFGTALPIQPFINNYCWNLRWLGKRLLANSRRRHTKKKRFKTP